MKKFRFSLRSVQTVRAIREMHAREAFGLALNVHSEAGTHLQSVRGDIRRLEELIISKRGAIVHAAEQVSFLHEHEFQRQREKDAVVALEKARNKLDECREIWIVARRDMRVIDNLETKARQEYRLEYEREEQALLDDRTNATFGRAPLLTS
jgi:flagellar export protein FliJ